MLSLVLVACLLDRDLYESRKLALSDSDGDAFVKEEDCDDTDGTVFPGADEYCDGVDDDCDGVVDDDAVDAPGWYPDSDGDGFGDGAAGSRTGCTPPTSTVADGTDCDDDNASVFPGATEVPYDDVDGDCDGSDLTDVDGDGHAAAGSGGGDCDDGDTSTFPGAEETWANGFTDNDCDGEIESIVHEYGGVAWSGWTEDDWLGRRIVALGDLDGNGLADVGIGSEYESTMGEGAGALYAVDGVPGGEVPRDRALFPTISGNYFASDVDGGNDTTGDGVPDLVITAIGGETVVGTAWLIDGAAWNSEGVAYADDVAVGIVEGSAPGTYGPTAVRFVGDVNGDGVEDIALGECCGTSAGLNTTGRVGIVSSDLFTGTIEDADVIIDGPWEETRMGGTIDHLGDQDGDGLSEIVVGGASGLAAAVVGGTRGGNLADLAITLVYGSVSWGYSTPRNAGDLDGDGGEDLVIIGDDAARQLYFFTYLSTAPLRAIEYPSFTFGWPENGSVTEAISIGDRDGDNRSEMFITQFFSDSGDERAWILSGSDVAFGTNIDASDSTLQAISVVRSVLYGYDAALAGDVDSDGEEDIVLGAPDYSAGALRGGGATLIAVPR